MSGQLTNSPKSAPPLPEPWTPEKGIRMWLDLMDTCEQFLLAGLRREIGPNGDLRAAYRRWYAAQMEEHDRDLARMLEELSRREGSHAR
jgi:hypothetical protein